MGCYRINQAKYGTHQLVARLLAPNDLVLDVGCNEGYLASLAPDCQFYGIDYDKSAVQIAAKQYKAAYQVDLNSVHALKQLDLPRIFDRILLIDVLEHLLSPEEILTELTQANLTEHGKVLISLPNVAHLSVRLNLLLGRFDYTETGILDKTHLHLYTAKSATQLIKRCGLKVKRIYGSSDRFGRFLHVCPFAIPLLGYNLIFECASAQKPQHL